jgi:hypothetical protein
MEKDRTAVTGMTMVCTRILRSPTADVYSSAAY